METLRGKFIAAALAGSIGLVACGGDSSGVSEPTTRARYTVIEYEYFEDGTRLTTFRNQNLAPVLSYCDGVDLMDQGLYYNHYGTNDISRAENHSACADGRLDPSDFELPPR